MVAGSSVESVDGLRQSEYFVSADEDSPPRTLRPYRLDQFQDLAKAVQCLRDTEGGFPRSKFHELKEAALIREPIRAEQACREVFSRLRPRQRSALWEAIERLSQGPIERFPWLARSQDDRRVCPLPDLVEAWDLLAQEMQ